MISTAKYFSWVEDLAKDEKNKALEAMRQHKKQYVNSYYLNAILAHTLTVAKKQGILNAYCLPALNLLPDKIPGKTK